DASTLQREPGSQDADRPLVPFTGLPTVRAVGLAGAPEVVAGRVVAAANQLDLRESVEHSASRFVKLNRTAHLERAMERIGRPRQIPEPHTDLTDRRERDRQAMARPLRF